VTTKFNSHTVVVYVVFQGEISQIQHFFRNFSASTSNFMTVRVLINENSNSGLLRTYQDPREPSLHQFYNMFICIRPHNNVLFPVLIYMNTCCSTMMSICYNTLMALMSLAVTAQDFLPMAIDIEKIKDCILTYLRLLLGLKRLPTSLQKTVCFITRW